MNTTCEIAPDEKQSLFLYIITFIEVLNVLISTWTSYHLGHFNFEIKHSECCFCCICDDFTVNLSDDESDSNNTKEKKFKNYGT